MQSPPIDPRTRADLAARLGVLAQRFSDWRPAADGRPDPGSALIGVAARFAEIAVERVNRIPERDYLAFLNLIGTRPLPPQPARVPLTFTLADGLALLPYRGNGMTGSTEGGLAAVRVGDTTLDGPTLLPSRHGNDVPLRTFVGDGIIWAVGQAGVASYDQDTLQARGFTAWQ